MKVRFDVTVLRCPHCRSFYVDASWYVIEMESDIEYAVIAEQNSTARKTLQIV